MSIKIPAQMRILAASEGGFIVYDGMPFRGDGYETVVPSFAGPLPECLDFVRDKLSPPEPEVCACRQMKPGEWRPA